MAPLSDAPPVGTSATRHQRLAGLLLAWAVFWILLIAIGVQEDLRLGRPDPWTRVFWEVTSCAVATVVAVVGWRLLPRLDPWLGRPWRWFGVVLLSLPVVAPLFVGAMFGLRHGLLALAGTTYRHGPWHEVLLYEAPKFAVFYLLGTAVAFGVRSYDAMTVQRLRAERARTLAKEAQLLQLAQQIAPHFLFNALNTIAATVHEDPERADALLTGLAALLRTATDLGRRPMATLDEELVLIEGYAQIMRARFGPRLNLTIDVDARARACTVPSLVLQPLLENAFRHGVEQRAGPCSVRVHAHCDGARLLIAVEDDAGELPAVPRFGTGLGNLHERLQALYGAAAALRLSPRAGGGVRAQIELPCPG